MAESRPRVMLVGSFGPGALERSYEAAFREIGCEVWCFDIAGAERRYCRLGHPGRLFNKFVPVESWVRKANREMVLKAREFGPGVLAVFGQNRVLPGPLAQIAAMSEVATVLVWPDTLVNLNASVIAALPLYDLVATYSSSTVSHFQRLGARQVAFVPLAADPQMHAGQDPDNGGNTTYGSDVCFIGQWRPEREAALAAVVHGLPAVAVKIWGPDWGRRSHDRALRRAWQGRALYGGEFARAVGSSRISLNVIDDTNYPAANMRFFEILCAGGLQVSSACPEMEGEFKHGETIFYWNDLAELPELIRSLLGDDSLRLRVARAAHQKVLKDHRYTNRAWQILKSLETV